MKIHGILWLCIIVLSCNNEKENDNGEKAYERNGNYFMINREFVFKIIPHERDWNIDRTNKIERELAWEGNSNYTVKELTYYSNGKIKSVEFFEQNKIHGEAFYFYPSGNLFEIRTYYKGRRIGKAYTFYDQKDGLLEAEFYIVPCHEPSDTLSCIQDLKVYNIDGLVRSDTTKLKVSFDKKEYYLDDSITVEIQIRYPHFKYSAVTIGNFDSSFQLLDSSNFNRQVFNGSTASFKIKASKVGLNTFRGYMEDIDPVDSYIVDSNLIFNNYRTIYYYFDTSYYVGSRCWVRNVF